MKALNPAAEAMQGPGVSEHVSVRAWSLGNSSGTHVQTSNVVTLSIATTASGDSLVAE